MALTRNIDTFAREVASDITDVRSRIHAESLMGAALAAEVKALRRRFNHLCWYLAAWITVISLVVMLRG